LIIFVSIAPRGGGKRRIGRASFKSAFRDKRRGREERKKGKGSAEPGDQ